MKKVLSSLVRFKLMAILLSTSSNSGVAQDIKGSRNYDNYLIRGSLLFRDLGAKIDLESPENCEALADPTLPMVYKQAFEAGTLVAIRDDDAFWVACPTPMGAKHFDLLRPLAVRNLTNALSAEKLRPYETPNAPQWVLLAPASEFGDGFSPELGYQDDWMDMLLSYNDNWLANDVEATNLNQEATALEAAVSDKSAALAASESTERERMARRDTLLQEISALDADLRTIVESAKPTSEVRANAVERFVYSKEKDYLAPVIAEQMVQLDPQIPILGGANGVTFPFVQKEVNDSLKAFFDNLSDSDLKQLGISSKTDLKLVSAARTPLKQCEVRKENKVAIGMFDTGHAFGVSIDIQFKGMPFDAKSYFDNGTTPSQLAALIRAGITPDKPAVQNALARYKSDPSEYQKDFDAKMKAWAKLNELLSKGGFRNAGPGDANHYNYKAFLANKDRYGTRVRIKMLRAYNQKMISERARQLVEADSLRKRKQTAQDKCLALDEAIPIVASRVEKYESEIKQLESKAAELKRLRDQRNREREESRRRGQRAPRRGDVDSADPPERRTPAPSGGGDPFPRPTPPARSEPAPPPHSDPAPPPPPVIIMSLIPAGLEGGKADSIVTSDLLKTERNQLLDQRFLLLRATDKNSDK